MRMLERSPVRSRSRRLPQQLAATLARARVTPDAVSLASLAAAATGAACLVLAASSSGAARAALLIGAAGSVQLRLLCNLLDGMLAVEGGRATPLGDLYNELPDRLSDALLLGAAGYAGAGAWGLALGFAAAWAALLSEYVRTLGAALGAPQSFGGLGKPQRMAVLTAACLAAALVPGQAGAVLLAAVTLAGAGALAASAQRLLPIARHLHEAGQR